MGIHLLIYFINNPKAALSERRKLAQKKKSTQFQYTRSCLKLAQHS